MVESSFSLLSNYERDLHMIVWRRIVTVLVKPKPDLAPSTENEIAFVVCLTLPKYANVVHFPSLQKFRDFLRLRGNFFSSYLGTRGPGCPGIRLAIAGVNVSANELGKGVGILFDNSEGKHKKSLPSFEGRLLPR